MSIVWLDRDFYSVAVALCFFQTVGDSFCNDGFYAVCKIQNKL